MKKTKEGTVCVIPNYNKQQACLYCHKQVFKIIRHLEDRHQNQDDVKKLLALPKSSKERNTLTCKLRNQGNFLHNIKVLKSGSGNIIPAKRPSEDVPYTWYYPCPGCLAFYCKTELWRHMQEKCQLKTKTKKSEEESVLTESRELLLSECLADKRLAKLYAPMKEDHILNVVKNDLLINQFASYLIDKQGQGRQDRYIRQRVRELGRFLSFVQKQRDNQHLQLATLIKPNEFDSVVNAVKSLQEEGSNATGPITLPLKLGHSLKRVAQIQRGQAVRNGENTMKEQCSSFLELYEAEWSDRVSSHTLRTMYDLKMNKIDELPVTNDVVKLANGLKEKINKLTHELEQCKKPDATVGRRLSEAVLARLILFNKRRGGEASKILLETYQEVSTEGPQINEEVFQSLDPLEKKLAEQHLLMKTKGKRGWHVPILIPQDARSGLAALVRKRKELGINDSNVYLFPIPGRDTHLSSWTVLNKFAQDFDLQKPRLVTSTKLWKYLATTAQILSLGEEGQDWLARHLGHDIRVHREFYRLHDNTIELAKVSKLLIAAEQGDLHKHKGKTLATMQVSGVESPVHRTSQPDNLREDTEETTHDSDLESDPEFLLENDEKPEKNIITREVREAMCSYFNDEVEAMKPPTKSRCLQYIKVFKLGIPWQRVKSTVYARIQLHKRNMKKKSHGCTS